MSILNFQFPLLCATLMGCKSPFKSSAQTSRTRAQSEQSEQPKPFWRPWLSVSILNRLNCPSKLLNRLQSGLISPLPQVQAIGHNATIVS